MDLVTYQSLVSSEWTAREFLIGKCLKAGPWKCPRCRAESIYTLADERRRCSQCRYTFHEFTGRWVNRGRLSSVQWLSLLKLFELDIAVAKIAEQVNIHVTTARRALDVIRMAILARNRSGSELLEKVWCIRSPGDGPAPPDDRTTQTAPPLLGIREGKGWVQVDLARDLTIPDLLDSGVSPLLGGPVLYADRPPQYDYLLLCGSRGGKVGRKAEAAIPVVPNRTRGAYWAMVCKRLEGMKRVEGRSFLLHLKELEFRYNHRDGDIFDLTTEYLCRFEPRPKLRSDKI